MVGKHLEGGEKGGHHQAREIFPPICQHDTGYHRWQVGQGPYFPDMSCRYNDEEITGERPDNGPQSRQRRPELKGSEQDVEAEEIDEDIPHIVWQPEVIGFGHLCEGIGTVVGGSRLVGWHSSKGGVAPSRPFSRSLVIFQCFLSGAPSRRGVVLVENSPLDVGREEIGKRDEYEHDHGDDVGQAFFQSFHCFLYFVLL